MKQEDISYIDKRGSSYLETNGGSNLETGAKRVMWVNTLRKGDGSYQRNCVLENIRQKIYSKIGVRVTVYIEI